MSSARSSRRFRTGRAARAETIAPRAVALAPSRLTLLTDACHCFRVAMVEGIEPNRARIQRDVEQSLMLVTPLTSVIGYDKASKIAKYAHDQGMDLRSAALDLGYVSAEEFDRVVDPAAMAAQQG